MKHVTLTADAVLKPPIIRSGQWSIDKQYIGVQEEVLEPGVTVRWMWGSIVIEVAAIIPDACIFF